MYQWFNKEKNRAFSAGYSECCKHKWTVEEWKNNGHEWKKTGFYARFDTLDEARDFAKRKLNNERNGEQHGKSEKQTD